MMRRSWVEWEGELPVVRQCLPGGVAAGYAINVLCHLPGFNLQVYAFLLLKVADHYE